MDVDPPCAEEVPPLVTPASIGEIHSEGIIGNHLETTVKVCLLAVYRTQPGLTGCSPT